MTNDTWRINLAAGPWSPGAEPVVEHPDPAVFVLACLIARAATWPALGGKEHGTGFIFTRPCRGWVLRPEYPAEPRIIVHNFGMEDREMGSILGWKRSKADKDRLTHIASGIVCVRSVSSSRKPAYHLTHPDYPGDMIVTATGAYWAAMPAALRDGERVASGELTLVPSRSIEGVLRACKPEPPAGDA